LAVLVIVLASLGGAGYFTYENNRETIAWGNSLTPTDVSVFSWIGANLPRNATILVDASGSGSWIPEFTDVRAFPFGELIDSPAVFRITQEIPSYFATHNWSNALVFLAEFNITFAFFGERTQYSVVPAVTPAEVGDAPSVGAFVRASSTCQPLGNESIRLTCNGDSVSFSGPVVLSLTEYHNGSFAGVTDVGVPSNTTWTFVLHSGTPESNGTWEANFTALPLGSMVYQDGGASVYRFDPTFLELATSGGAILLVPVSGTLPPP
jgi:hypothetical protein